MKNHLKYALSLIILFGILVACNSDKSEKDKKTTQTQPKDTTKINKDQYRIAEQFTGSRNQIIDLMKGPANFVTIHTGEGKFTARLMTADGEVLMVLADVTGDYNGKKLYEVPETKAYILDVKTEGVWSVYRE
ncbi:MAG: hypothetical protein IAE90_07560 [Ignavibacteria bacterium]|nr:hypothetical protein [Ignavibacteria bacterium]